jgi:hypothetical protein
MVSGRLAYGFRIDFGRAAYWFWSLYDRITTAKKRVAMATLIVE